MIPKIIHYCWFGGGEKTKLVNKCIKSWKKYCTDYQIIEWNEDNYDISSAPLFVRQAYEAKKWAFVTDYIRYHVVYEYGGCYFDTDVEMIKNMNRFLNDPAFFGFEYTSEFHIASGLGFGAEKRNPLLRELMALYEEIPFILADKTEDQMPCPQRECSVFIRHGLRTDGTEQFLDNQTHIYPVDFFSPLSYSNRKLNRTINTATIHWYAATWWTKEQQEMHLRWIRRDNFVHFPNRLGMKLLGMKRYNRLKKLFGKTQKTGK